MGWLGGNGFLLLRALKKGQTVREQALCRSQRLEARILEKSGATGEGMDMRGDIFRD